MHLSAAAAAWLVHHSHDATEQAAGASAGATAAQLIYDSCKSWHTAGLCQLVECMCCVCCECCRVGDFLYVQPDTFDSTDPSSSEDDEEDEEDEENAGGSDEEAADKDKVRQQVSETIVNECRPQGQLADRSCWRRLAFISLACV